MASAVAISLVSSLKAIGGVTGTDAKSRDGGAESKAMGAARGVFVLFELVIYAFAAVPRRQVTRLDVTKERCI